MLLTHVCSPVAFDQPLGGNGCGVSAVVGDVGGVLGSRVGAEVVGDGLGFDCAGVDVGSPSTVTSGDGVELGSTPVPAEEPPPKARPMLVPPSASPAPIGWPVTASNPVRATSAMPRPTAADATSASRPERSHAGVADAVGAAVAVVAV